MKIFLQIAAGFAAAFAPCLHAQIVSPEVLIPSAPSAPHTRPPAKAARDLQWMWDYAKPSPNGKKMELLADSRLTALLEDNFRAPQAFWSTPGSPLADAARTFLGGEGVVTSGDERHVTVTGCVVQHCAQRGLLWTDLGERDPLLVFSALRWNEQGHTTDEANASFTLWIFPSRTLDAHQLPGALKQSLTGWVEAKPCAPSGITSAIVVDPNGVPHILGTLDVLTLKVCTVKPETKL